MSVCPECKNKVFWWQNDEGSFSPLECLFCRQKLNYRWSSWIIYVVGALVSSIVVSTPVIFIIKISNITFLQSEFVSLVIFGGMATVGFLGYLYLAWELNFIKLEKVKNSGHSKSLS